MTKPNGPTRPSRMLTVALALALPVGGALITYNVHGVRAAAPEDNRARGRAAALAYVSEKTKISVEDLDVSAEAESESEAIGGIALHFKIRDKRSGTVTGVSVKPNGNVIPASEFLATENSSRAARYGKLSPGLAKHIEGKGAADTVEVSIQLDDSDYEPPSKPIVGDDRGQITTAEADAILRQATEKRRAYIKALHEKAEAELRTIAPDAAADDLTPTLVARVKPGQISRLAAVQKVKKLDLVTRAQNSLQNAKDVVGYNLVQVTYNIRGTGVRVAQIELEGPIATANPFLNIANQAWNGTCSAGHATAVAGAIRSTSTADTGSAIGVELFAGGRCTNDFEQVKAESNDAVTWGARSLNLSWGGDSGGKTEAVPKFYDDLIINQFRSVLVAAGNNGAGSGWVNDAGTAYNAVTVGNFDDRNTFTWTDDIMNAGSAWKNPTSTFGDREKPDIAAPGTDINTTSTASPWLANATGTSFATPMVTGTTALLIQANSGLNIWPEGIKAVLLASAIHNIEGSARLSDRDGAGGLLSNAAVDAARGTNGGFRTSSVDCSAGDVNFSVPMTGGRATRVVLAFDSNPTDANYGSQPSADLDLELWAPNGGFLNSSTSFDSTAEILTVTTTTTGNYTIKVTKPRCTTTPRWMAVAWYQQ